MKKLFYIFILTFSVLGLNAQNDTLIGPHKGRLQSYTNYHVELVGCNDYLEIYFFDSSMLMLNNKYGISGDVKFYFPNEVYSSSPLVSYGADGFTAKIPTPDYMYCRVTATINGHPISVKFNNECTAAVGHK